VWPPPHCCNSLLRYGRVEINLDSQCVYVWSDNVCGLMGHVLMGEESCSPDILTAPLAYLIFGLLGGWYNPLLWGWYSPTLLTVTSYYYFKTMAKQWVPDFSELWRGMTCLKEKKKRTAICEEMIPHSYGPSHLPTDKWKHPALTQTGKPVLDLPTVDWRLSWPRWLATYRDSLRAHRQSQSPIQVVTGLGVD